MDLFPILRQKTSNIISNRDLFESSLTLFWKLIRNPNRYIEYSSKQLVIGIPDLLPFKYPKKGELNKKIAGKNITWEEKKTGFYCRHPETNEELIGILGKILDITKKQFQIVGDR